MSESAEVWREAAERLVAETHERAHREVCENQHRSDRTAAHVALDVAADWLRTQAKLADALASTDSGSEKP